MLWAQLRSTIFNMPRSFRPKKKFWVSFGLLAVSFRVFTGAPEAQVNFTSILVDQIATQKDSPDQHQVGEIAPNIGVISSDAKTIPEKHRSTATYKKYLTPDNFVVTLNHESAFVPPPNSGISFTVIFSDLELTYLPKSHSPPVVVSAQSHIHTSTAVHSVILEKDFGEITIYNNIGGLGRLKL